MSIRSDPELRRAHWRKMSNRRYHRLKAMDPEKWRAEMRAREARQRELHPERFAPKTHHCATCGAAFQFGEGEGRRRYCDAHRLQTCNGCGIGFERRSRRRGDNAYHSQECYFDYLIRTTIDRRVGRRCRVWFFDCDVCGRLFTARTPQAKRCSDECRRVHVNDSQRAWQREYERRTRHTAIRYWAVDDSPEALEVAATYFELRQQLREQRHASR